MFSEGTQLEGEGMGAGSSRFAGGGDRQMEDSVGGESR